MKTALMGWITHSARTGLALWRNLGVKQMETKDGTYHDVIVGLGERDAGLRLNGATAPLEA
ncbi:MAG: hypothetical protein IIB16_10925 [Chloroflexi bacterium]|nr:hypothetical protein [Chloroflexota bacterium]